MFRKRFFAREIPELFEQAPHQDQEIREFLHLRFQTVRADQKLVDRIPANRFEKRRTVHAVQYLWAQHLSPVQAFYAKKQKNPKETQKYRWKEIPTIIHQSIRLILILN